ncbi:protein-L-isoaspartate(D-aspartate) O-methyltransferase [Anaeromyxobacter paludicola]|uniref:protein-L-isoaspartate(D-aspartate) O-methyltransferase n=1 Tax=Anaeromyxobacter paludicola TaxID=2918171 RepID=UPI00202B6FBA|nr:protein-L-isoaspartate(D-aspartate) O-methyltransferase [Anaeromyxobacter paludicola]
MGPHEIERLRAQGIADERVLDALARLDRGRFVPGARRSDVEEDRPLPIGHGQTISQPFIVGYMTQLLRLGGEERVLEIGTGSGFQTAVLALLAREVFSVEIVPELAARAAQVLLGELGLRNVRLRIGDGSRGWPEQAPFDRILVTAAPDELPEELAAQLAPGGVMVVPIGSQEADSQVLALVERSGPGELTVKSTIPVRFVPLTRGGTGPGAGLC